MTGHIHFLCVEHNHIKIIGNHAFSDFPWLLPLFPMTIRGLGVAPATPSYPFSGVEAYLSLGHQKVVRITANLGFLYLPHFSLSSSPPPLSSRPFTNAAEPSAES